MAKLRHIWLMDRYTYSTVGPNMLSVHVQAYQEYSIVHRKKICT